MTRTILLATLLLFASSCLAGSSDENEAALCEAAESCEKCAGLALAGHQCVYAHGISGTILHQYGCVAGNASGPFNVTDVMRSDTHSSFQFGFCCMSMTGADCGSCIGLSPECRFMPSVRHCGTRVSAINRPDLLAVSSCDGCYSHETCRSCLTDTNCTYCLSSSMCVPPGIPRACPVTGNYCNCSHSTCETCQQYSACMWEDYGAMLPRACIVKADADVELPLPTCDPAPRPCHVYDECHKCVIPGCKWCHYNGAPHNFTFDDRTIVASAMCLPDATPCPDIVPGLPRVASHECPDCPQVQGCRDCTSHDNSCVWCLDSATCSGGPPNGMCVFWGTELAVAPSTCPAVERCPNVGCSDCNLTPGCRYCHAEGRCKLKDLECGGRDNYLFQSCEEYCAQYQSVTCTSCNTDPQCEFCAGNMNGGSLCLARPAKGQSSICLPDHLTLGHVCKIETLCFGTTCAHCIATGLCSFCPTTRHCARIVPRVGDTPAHRLEPCFGSYGVNTSCYPGDFCRAQAQICSTCVATPGCLYAAETDECDYFERPSYEDGKWNNRCDTILDITLNYTATRYMFKGDAFYYRLAVEQPNVGAIHIDPHSRDVLLIATARAQRPTARNGEFSNENQDAVLTIFEGAASITATAYYVSATCQAEQCVLKIEIRTEVLVSTINASALPSFLSFGLVGLVLVCVAGVAVRCVCRRRRRRAGGMTALLNDEDGDVEPHGVIFQALIPPSRNHTRTTPLTLDGGHGPRDAVAIIGPADVDVLASGSLSDVLSIPSSPLQGDADESAEAPLLSPASGSPSSALRQSAAVAHLEQLWLGVRIGHD